MTDEKQKSIENSEEGITGINEYILQKNEWFVYGRQNQWTQSSWNGKMPSHPMTLCNDLDRKKLLRSYISLSLAGICAALKASPWSLSWFITSRQPSTTELPATLTTPYYLKTFWKLTSCLPLSQGKTVINTIILIFVSWLFTAWRASLKLARWDKSGKKATESHSLIWKWKFSIAPILQLPRKFYEYIFFEFQRNFYCQVWIYWLGA